MRINSMKSTGFHSTASVDTDTQFKIAHPFRQNSPGVRDFLRFKPSDADLAIS
jgi:hypothetical protein